MESTPATGAPANTSTTTHPGTLRISGDSTSAAIEANVSFAGDGRIVVTSAGMTLIDCSTDEIVFEPAELGTTIRCRGDILTFVPMDDDAWTVQIAAHTLRSRLTASRLAVRTDAASQMQSDRARVDADSRRDVPVIQVMQNTSVRTPRKTTHWLHLLLTVLTFGMWLPVWIGVSIFTGIANTRSTRTVVPRPAQPWAPTQQAGPVDPAAVRNRNRSFFTKVAVGLAAVLLIGVVSVVASSAKESDLGSVGVTSTTQAASRQPAATDTVRETSVTSPNVSSADIEAQAILAGTSGMLRVVLVDLMDTNSCDDLEFDLQFAMDNFVFDDQAAGRVLRAVEYAQENGIGGDARCSGLDPYVDSLSGSA